MQNLKSQIKSGMNINQQDMSMMGIKSPEKFRLDTTSPQVANNLFANLQHIDGIKQEYSMMSPYR